ncbi:hypothetical protein RJT34_11590 [Clitoria ternatea]|uniref:Peptidase A1 domain-containing protein n=1 Tax=Clitoria ternatea TaxID=43366 RepID=A0AAN9PJN7_CLITE
MASSKPSLCLLLHSLTIPLLFILLPIQTTTCSVSPPQTQKPIILSLKAHTQTPSTPSSRKLTFHHNVTLTVTLTVGSPPQNVTMVLDTGSELSWLYCKKLPKINSIFNPLLSSSYTPTPCNSSACTTRTRDFSIPVSCDPGKLCHVIVSYADASSTEGNLATETFFIGDSSQPGTVFGCMDSGYSSNVEEDSKITGLMGMNRGSLSFVTQMGLPRFSYCISSHDASGVLLLGGGGGVPWLGPLQYTPLVTATTSLPYFDRVAYTVQLEGIKVSEKLLQLPKSVFVPDHTGAGQTMVDSGTQFTFLLGSVYNALKNEFLEQTKGILTPVEEEPKFVFEGAMDLCFRAPASGLAEVPAVTMVFEGAEMKVSGERLLYRVRKGNDWVECFTFGNSDMLGIEAYVIGHHHQQNVWMEFDLVNSRVGFTDTSCELASQRLGLGN